MADSDDTLIGLGIVFLRSGRVDKGIEAVRKVLEQRPFHPQARHLLGKLYFISNRFEAAALELQEAQRLAPDDFSVAYTLALAFLKRVLSAGLRDLT